MGRNKHRVRQHANPLNHRAPLVIPTWSEVLAEPELPTEVDVGSAHGDFLAAWAAQRPDLNVVGLEIRKLMAERVNRRLTRENLRNAYVVHCNANTALTELFKPSSLRTVYVHFPDPWFKKKHHKRRIMTPAFVQNLAVVLEPGGLLRFMTDYGEYAAEVVEFMATQEAFESVPFADLEPRPLTHREEWHRERKGEEIHAYGWRRRA